MTKQIKPCSCGKSRTKDWHLACPDCWSLISKRLQDEVFHLFKTERGSLRHVACVRRCYEAINLGRRILGTSEMISAATHDNPRNDKAEP